MGESIWGLYDSESDVSEEVDGLNEEGSDASSRNLG